MSESLINIFIKPTVSEHSGGHYVTCSDGLKYTYQDFLKSRHQELVEENSSDKNEKT